MFILPHPQQQQRQLLSQNCETTIHLPNNPVIKSRFIYFLVMSLSSPKHDLTACIMHRLFHNASRCVLIGGAPWRAELSSSCFIELCMGGGTTKNQKKHKCKSLISGKKKVEKISQGRSWLKGEMFFFFFSFFDESKPCHNWRPLVVFETGEATV